MGNKTARLTVLIDPARKDAFEKLCHSQDMTPSQVTRRLIRDYLVANGYPPTVRELSRMLGLRSTATTQQHLRALARKGYLEHDPVKARALRVVWKETDIRER